MGNKINYYQILGVPYNATFNEIKEAYRKKVKEYHPDKEKGDAERFKRLKESYEILKNAETRKRYDELLFKKMNPSTNPPQQDVPSQTNPTITLINIRRKSSKRIPYSSLTLNAALILIRIMGKTILKKDKS